MKKPRSGFVPDRGDDDQKVCFLELHLLFPADVKHQPHERSNAADDWGEPIDSGEEVEALWRNEYVGGADGRHPKRGDEGHDEILVRESEVDGYGPEGEDGERLIRPREISPYDVEAVGVLDAVYEDEEGEDENGDGDEETLGDGLLLYVEIVGHDEARRAQGCIARRYGRGDNSEDGEDAAERPEPLAGERRGYTCARIGMPGGGINDAMLTKESGSRGSPDEGYDALGDHGAIEDGATEASVFEASGHEG